MRIPRRTIHAGHHAAPTEDINQDQNLSENESYFQYKVSLRPRTWSWARTTSPTASWRRPTRPTGSKQVYWYQFKVPIREPERKVNGIQDFRSIRFMRMFMKGWTEAGGDALRTAGVRAR
jgi:cell surface protein SprA